MAEAVYETTSVKIGAGDYRFNVAASKVKFDGFMTVYSYDSEKSTMNAAMKKITKDTEITLSGLDPQQHFNTAASTFYRSFSCKNLRRIRNRSSKHLCANNYYSFSKKIYCKRK
jgi:DNA topoisomerase I (EC 5.99.1.2)